MRDFRIIDAYFLQLFFVVKFTRTSGRTGCDGLKAFNDMLRSNHNYVNKKYVRIPAGDSISKLLCGVYSRVVAKCIHLSTSLNVMRSSVKVFRMFKIFLGCLLFILLHFDFICYGVDVGAFRMTSFRSFHPLAFYWGPPVHCCLPDCCEGHLYGVASQAT